jgi:hypothetical protein
VKRTSGEAKRLSSLLVKEGHQQATERRIERWSQENLGPLDKTPSEAELAHYRALAEMSRSGIDADVTARRLAARGHICARLVPAILEELGLSQLEDGEAVVSFEPNPATEGGFVAVEAVAQAMQEDLTGMPPLLVRMVKALRRNARRQAKLHGRSAEELFQSFLINSLCHLFGDDIYDPDAIAAVLNLEAGSIPPEIVDEMNSRIHIHVRDIDDAYRNADPGQIVVVAPRLVSVAQHLLNYLEIQASAAEIEDLATLVAPFVTHYFTLLRDAFDDVDENFSFEGSELASMALTTAPG